MTPDGTDSLSTALESNTQTDEQPCVPQASGNFPASKPHTEQKADSCPAKKSLSEPKSDATAKQADSQTDWCYIYLHNRKIEAFKTYMDESSPFQSFVMKARPRERKEDAAKRKANNSVCKTPQQLIIGGIVFIQGAPEDILHFFKEKSLSLTLVRDCATQCPAVLPDRMMRPLRQVVELASERIGFLSKPFAHYAKGHDLVRIIEGPLTGLEGCILRIDKDRKLVMQVGSLTLAIAKAHREVFETVPKEETIPLRKPIVRKLTCLQEEMDKSLFFPQSQAEVGMYADNVELLMRRALQFLDEGKEEMTTDMFLFLLDEISYHFEELYETSRFDLTPIDSAKRQLSDTISLLLADADGRLSATEKKHLSMNFDSRMLAKATD